MDHKLLIRLEIESMIGHKLKGLTIKDLQVLSDECYQSYNDAIGLRLDSLINIMKLDREAVVK